MSLSYACFAFDILNFTSHSCRNSTLCMCSLKLGTSAVERRVSCLILKAMQDLFAGSSIGRGTSDGTGSQAETVDSLASTNIFYHAKHVPCGAECKFCHHKVTLAILTLAKPFLFLAKSFDPDVENIIFFCFKHIIFFVAT